MALFNVQNLPSAHPHFKCQTDNFCNLPVDSDANFLSSPASSRRERLLIVLGVVIE